MGNKDKNNSTKSGNIETIKKMTLDDGKTVYIDLASPLASNLLSFLGPSKKHLSKEEVEAKKAEDKAKEAAALQLEQQETERVLKEQYGDDIAYTSFARNFGQIASETYPELQTKKLFVRNLQQVASEVKKLQTHIEDYHSVLDSAGELGLTRVVKDGKVYLQNGDETNRVPLQGKPKAIIKAVETATANAKKHSNHSDEKNDDELVSEETLAPALAETNGNGQKRNGPYIAGGEVLSRENTPTRSYALHDTLYQGKIPDIGKDKIVVVLDAGVMQRCFGVDGGEKAHNLTPEKLLQLRNFGKEVFDSLVNNPRVAAVIIPDYVADIECCDRITDYHDGTAKAEFLREEAKPGGEFFHTQMEEMFKHAVRRWEDDSGNVQYMQDSTVAPESINPKVIVWESKHGKKYIEKFLQEKKTYITNLKYGRKADVPGADLGEYVIEALMADPAFPAGKKLVLSTDYRYVHGDAMPIEKTADITRSNLGNYLQSLILTDTKKWAEVSGYTSKTEVEETGVKMVVGIRDLMRENFNDRLHPKHADDHLKFVYCDNPELFSEITGLKSAGKDITDAQVVAAAKGIEPRKH